MSDIVSRLKTKRIERRMSQAKLAEAMGWIQSRIGNYESGKREIPEGALMDLAEFFGVSVDWLKTGKTEAAVSISGNNKISNSSITAMVNNSAGSDQDIALAQEEPDDEHNHRLDYLDVRAAAGMTMEFQNSDYPEIIRSIWLSDEGMRELVGRSNTKGLSIIVVPTDSMEPTIMN